VSGLTAVSLFAGVGGIDRALEAAGFLVTTAVEIDKDCRGVLARHFPRTTLREDVTEVTGDDLIADGFVPGTGLLAFGWPCQGNSVAGGRGGLGDPRSGLWRHCVRLLAETRPRWFLGENVPGLYSVNGGADIAVVRNDLAQLGYWWAERILDAQHFGVPQRRSRIFLVGCAGDGAAPVEVLLEPESSQGHPAARRAAGKSAARSAPAGAGDTRTVGTIGGSGPGGGWRVGGDEAAAGQLIPLLEINGRQGEADGTNAGLGVGGDGDPMFTLQAGKQHGVAMLLPGSEGLHGTAATLQGGGRRGHRIDAEGAAGGHLIPFDTVQITSGENRSNPRPGDPSPTLNGNGATCTSPLPFSVGETSAAITAHHGKGPDSDATNGLIIDPGRRSLALPAGDRVRDRREGKGADSDATSGLIIAPAVAATLTSGAHSEGTSAPGRHDEDQFNLVAQPLALRGRGDGSNVELGDEGDPAFTLRTPGGGSSYPMVAHALTSEGADASEDGTGAYGTSGVPRPVPSSLADKPMAFKPNVGTGEIGWREVAGAVTEATPTGVQLGLAVRRLTPKECERLQGLPDDWTRWKLVDGELVEQSDSARYRQVGNAVAVPCVQWITERIAACDAALRASAADEQVA
jgi:DNA (cytosine-5)-methyltransferase 1